MQQIVECLAAQHDELDILLSGLDAGDWSRSTRCPGWTVADVVLHLAQTNELAVASVQGRLTEFASGWTISVAEDNSIDDAAAAVVSAQRGAPAVEVLTRWRCTAAAERAALASCDPRVRLAWVAGELSARTLATARLAESWIHSGDIADALGVKLTAGDRLWHVARLAWRTLPYAFARADSSLAGPVSVVLEAPSGEVWSFGDHDAVTTVRGDAVEFCLVAGRRLSPAQTRLRADGPDAAAVLDLVRTYA